MRFRYQFLKYERGSDLYDKAGPQELDDLTLDDAKLSAQELFNSRRLTAIVSRRTPPMAVVVYGDDDAEAFRWTRSQEAANPTRKAAAKRRRETNRT